MKSIYIVLTKSETILSKIIYMIDKDLYMHASISFESDLSILYSSSRKNGKTILPAGPCREYLDKGYLGNHPSIRCAVYRLYVPDEVYEKTLYEVLRIINNNEQYHFNIIGLIACKLHIPLSRQHHFFCSQFVSEVLGRSGALEIPKETSLMKPIDYTYITELTCCYQGNIGELAVIHEQITGEAI